jgi:cellobiose phosphorylase
MNKLLKSFLRKGKIIQTTANTALEFLTQLRLYFLGDTYISKYKAEEPLRSELLSSQQLEQHSHALANAHEISAKQYPDALLLRLASNEKILLEVRNLLTESVKSNNPVTPAGEWLLDNFYLIEEQIRLAKKHLPVKYSESLPQLSSGTSAGLPRVYDIGIEIISHSDGRVDMDSLNDFMHTYNKTSPLQLGELWAIPIMLRLALIENLRRVSSRIAIDRINRNLAVYWTSQMIATVEKDPKNLILVIADMARSDPPMERAFITEFFSQLRGKEPSLSLVLNWVEERLMEAGLSSSDLIQEENQKQAADQVSISNTINSLRLLGNLDWRNFVESNSVVEKILLADKVYPKLSFSTRDQYRHSIERIAKRSPLQETDVAHIAMRLTREQTEKDGEDGRSAHVGFFLIDDGLHQLEQESKMALPFLTKVRRLLSGFPLFIYLGSVILISAGITMPLLLKIYHLGVHSNLLVLIGFFLLFCVSQFVVSLVNFIVTLTVQPDILPRMDFSSGIPDESRTLVTIPALITDINSIDDLVEGLEVRFLANKCSNLHFGLLTDFADAMTEHLPEDEELLKYVQKKIHQLNEKYAGAIFSLFHRPRKWNQQERKWMGYERKRGKLSDLNKLLRGNSENDFSIVIANLDFLQSVKYVITLDADTQLPRETAWEIVGTIAHPLNKGVYDENKQRVIKGYGILQPRVSVSMPDAGSSRFARLHGNEPGIDPYTRSVSDVYQDLFHEGSFIGKGVYDVDLFERTFSGRFPDNQILSHDLLEGCYARSGLISDIQLYEKYPVRYDVDMKRRHRWIRGDWQIGVWCLPFVPLKDGRWQKNPLNSLSRWKIFDNLRRSLVPFSFTVFILISWFLLPAAAIWTLVITLIIILPSAFGAVWDLFRKPEDVIFSHHIKNLTRTTGSTAVKTMFTVICLPHEAYVYLGAILRTLWRILISRKKLLEWSPYNPSHSMSKFSLIHSYKSMWFEPFLGVASLAALIVLSPIKLAIATPILVLWMVAPVITWYVSKPLGTPLSVLSATENIFLQKQARKIWAFFESFVTEKENWLPPDNYQENPGGVIAHRTSPTNIGLSLLSNLSAYDFGYIGTNALLARTSGIFNTMSSMERFRGHFLNWYDTLSLQPLYPKYVSTVDSGNFVGHLLTFRQGLLRIIDQKIAGSHWFTGLMNTYGVFSEKWTGKDPKQLRGFKTAFKKMLLDETASLNTIFKYLLELQQIYNDLKASIPFADESEAQWWYNALGNDIQNKIEELKIFAPWLFIASENLTPEIKNIPTLRELAELSAKLRIETKNATALEEKTNEWNSNHLQEVEKAGKAAADKIAMIENLAQQCYDFSNIEYDFLYNKTKHLMTVGYHVDEHRSDTSYYDLLASEARLSTYVGISQGKLPQESWFALSRLLTNTGVRPILLSWSGSMFEYLMPLLVMPSYENTLLYQTDKAAVDIQIDYGKQRGVPWGVSESCYNMVDASLNYQYRAFGVPGLGLKRGLGEDLVVAPYATFLAMMVSPLKAIENLMSLTNLGFEGRYGFYEAIDYTASRLRRGQNYAIVQSYMTHHQGMSLLAVSYVLHNKPMQYRFEEETQFKASLLLLQERIPKTTSFFAHTTNIADVVPVVTEPSIRIIKTPNTPVPEVQLLSNGKYHVMVTNSGGGYSRWRDLAVTRWREDGTCDNWGSFCYIRDLETGTYWSNTFQPVHADVKNYEAAFSLGRADFKSSLNKIEAHTEIVVSPEDDIEMRRIHITNRTGKKKTLDITTYSEVVIAQPAADAFHTAFSNLFVQTKILSDQNAILCTRRPRSAGDKLPWMFHLIKVHDKNLQEVSFETDRLAFIGRGNTVQNPQAMNVSGKLGGHQGSVLDPIVSIRTKIILEDDESITLDMIYGIGDTQEICQGLIDKYQDKHHKDRVFELAWTHNQVVLRHINATEPEAQLYSRLANSVIFMNPVLRGAPATLIKNNRGQPGLWPYSISGDLPIVLLKIEEQTDIELVKHVVQAHIFWKAKGLAVDLVIWNDSHGGYRQILQNQVAALINSQPKDQPGGIFYRASEQISTEDRILFESVARVIISSAGGTLADHVNLRKSKRIITPGVRPSLPKANSNAVKENAKLLLYNGYGGFSEDGNEYIIITEEEKRTPAPWSNVIANAQLGTVISESGQCYTWSENAHELRLTPWANDPVCDSGGEVFYLKDEEGGQFWSATALPAGSASEYKTRHGFGYSIFEHEEMGIYSELTVYVDIDASVKFSVLKIKNTSATARKISVTGYVEWVLGDLRQKTAMHVVTEVDAETGAILAKNSYNTEFPGRVAFFDVEGGTNKMMTCDRYEFIGRNGHLKNPAAMYLSKFSGKMSVGLDPCTALQVTVELARGQEKEVIFKIGAGKNYEEVKAIIQNFKGSNTASDALKRVNNYWEKTHDVLKVETPDTTLNLLANGWLNHQTLSSRIRGRSGYYQSGGAFGFRDQLQDVISLLHVEPELARQQLLLCASRQFKEGDVQHWWHPPVGRGVRTHCSDDFLWLPFVCTRYIQCTNDLEILNEMIPFLEGRLLNPEEESYYDLANVSSDKTSLYDHCVRAVKHGLRFGGHGLPLMGSGDWNDGMDRVGIRGKGESIWLAFFLYDVLMRFIPLAKLQKDEAFAKECETSTQQLKENIQRNGWDGNWYRRAYFDDGSPLGSSTNEECKIDSISQSWAVLSEGGDSKRNKIAMESAYHHLVKSKGSLIQLLEPPFDKSSMDPGYIKGYVPGVRENGGQYTHAAVWLIMAFAKLGNHERAWELFSMINPLNHGKSSEEIEVYKVEPYVVAADVYAVPPHTGRGGWTWYTGSAGWMYQLITRSLLGINMQHDKLIFTPCIPKDWDVYKIHYRYKNTYYPITFIQVQEEKKMQIVFDGKASSGNSVTLIDDGNVHEIQITISRSSS